GGQASFAVLLFQDLSVVPLFMLLALLAPGGAGAVDPWAVVKALAVVVAIILASRTVLRPVMRVIAETGMREIFVAFSLLLVIGVSIAVQSVGLSMALGTFLAGVLLADSEYRYELRLDIEPVKGLLLGLFFIAVGMSVDMSLIVKAPVLILGLALLLVLVKAAILYGLGRLFHLASRDALLFAVGLSQVGEFAFVIFGIGLSQGSLDRETYNVLNAVVAVSMLTTPLLLVLYDRFAGLQAAPPDDDAIEEENPVIVAGFGRFGQIVGRVLLAHGIPATLIDKDPNQVELMRSFGWRCYYGDASRLDLLQQAGIAKASLFVIALDDPHAALETARLVKERWPEVPIVARARSRTDAFDFHELGIEPIRETFHSALEAARQALVALKVSASGAARIVRQFDRHDQELMERALKVRHDREALIDLTEQGRQDLKVLLAAESGDLEEDELIIR
ncbi:MAG: cation:proton antiporter, partial [Methylophilaceae bacterium]